jgi:hypothetical protein
MQFIDLRSFRKADSLFLEDTMQLYASNKELWFGNNVLGRIEGKAVLMLA